VPAEPQRDSSVSLGSHWHEDPKKKRRSSGSRKTSTVRRPSAGSLGGQPKRARKSRAKKSLSDGLKRTSLDQSVSMRNENLENTLARDSSRTLGGGEFAPAQSTTGPSGLVAQSPAMSAFTPRADFESTPRAGLDFTPGFVLGTSFQSASQRRFGANAESTPFVRGDRPSLGLASFERLNLGGDSSPVLAGQSGVQLDGTLSGDDRIPYSAKGKARAEDKRNAEKDTTGEDAESDSDDNQEVVPESSQPPDPARYRAVSVDSSVVVEMSSPDRSLRTERVSTPRAARVSLVGDSDDEEEDLPPSPSAGRQSFNERGTQPIDGRRLSDILKLREQARNRSDSARDDNASHEITTRLDNSAQEVLNSPPTTDGTLNGWPEVATSETRATSADSNEVSKSSGVAHTSLSGGNLRCASIFFISS
jgi:hypothetical protein